MTSLDPVRGTIVEPDDVELERWIADGWVRPRDPGGSGTALQGIDIARCQRTSDPAATAHTFPLPPITTIATSRKAVVTVKTVGSR